jgi:mono/diheme cytochrome c family protein
MTVTHLRRALVVLWLTFVAVQAVPYGHRHTNPPVTREPAWDSADTRRLAVRVCFDCHSHEVRWPWYAHVAPLSWLVQHDVEEGRRELNFSAWDRPQREAGKAAREVRGNEMPPWYYTLPHLPERLTASERAALVRGLEATLGSAPPRATK